jgi:hypothetical protein
MMCSLLRSTIRTHKSVPIHPLTRLAPAYQNLTPGNIPDGIFKAKEYFTPLPATAEVLGMEIGPFNFPVGSRPRGPAVLAFNQAVRKIFRPAIWVDLSKGKRDNKKKKKKRVHEKKEMGDERCVAKTAINLLQLPEANFFFFFFFFSNFFFRRALM